MSGPRMNSRDERLAWRPAKPRATRRPAEVRDPVLEPFWSGRRVLAHFVAPPGPEQRASVELLDEDGQPVNETVPDIVDELSQSVMALEAVIDGVLTSQPTVGGEGTALIPEARAPRLSLFLPRSTDITYERRLPADAPAARMAFVAVDLLSVDDQPLLDLPLLERKRQLESLFIESELLRFSPMARPPVGPWLNSWRAAGFAGLMMKAANSRYRPGDFTLEWVFVQRQGTSR
jgi:ATP-dependent DNA ligase